MFFESESEDGISVNTGTSTLVEGYQEIELAVEFDSEFAVVMVEDLDGEVESVEINHTATDISKNPSIKLYCAKNLRRGQKVVLKIGASLSNSVRITVAFIAKAIRVAGGLLSCKMCKTMMRLLVSALLASSGIIDLSAIEVGGHDILSADQLEALRQFFDDAIPSELSDMFDSEAWGYIKKGLIAFDWLTDSVDKLYTKLCIALGSCKEKQDPKLRQNNIQLGGEGEVGRAGGGV